MPTSSNPAPPHLDPRLAAAAAFVRPGSVAADIGCDHGKLSAYLAGSGRCPRVIAADLRPGPLQKAKATCAPWGDRVELRLGSGLSVLRPGEAQDIIVAGMGAETICEILAAAPWSRDPALNFVLVPATKHSELRRWLARAGYELRAETLCRAAGRFYAVMNARYTGQCTEPGGFWCVCGKTAGQPGAAEYRAEQCGKLKKFRRGLAPGSGQAAALDALIGRLSAPEQAPPQEREQSMEPQEILRLLENFAPASLAESWDNVGLLVDAGRPVTGVLTALEITPAVIAEAAARQCELIVCHHPVIFDPLKAIAAGDLPALLLQSGVSAICMHTNLDAAPGGVNDTLAGLLGMRDTEPFAGGCGRIGTVEPTTVPALAALCRRVLGAHCKFVDPGKPVARLAEVSGSGGSFWAEARALGADCLVTGEASHHAACDAARLGMGLVVAGHWATERPIAAVLAQKLAGLLPGLRVCLSDRDADPFCYAAE